MLLWKPRTVGHCLPWYGSKIWPLEIHKGLGSPSLVSEGQAALPGAPELKLNWSNTEVSTEQRGEGARADG